MNGSMMAVLQSRSSSPMKPRPDSCRVTCSQLKRQGTIAGTYCCSPKRIMLMAAAVILAVIIAGAVTGVLLAARDIRRRALDKAGECGQQALVRLTDDLHVDLSAGPLGRLVFTSRPSQSDVMALSKNILPRWAASLAPAAMLQTIAIMPMGRHAVHYPPVEPGLETLFTTWDSLAPPNHLNASLRSDTLASIVSDKAILYTGNSTDHWFGILFALWAAATSRDENWGWPNNTTGAEACASGEVPACFDATTGRKWWGQLLLAFNRTMALRGLTELSRLGYGYQLTSSYSSAATTSDSRGLPVVLTTGQGFEECQSPTVEHTSSIIDDIQWTLSVCLTSPPDTAWLIPALVAVVVGPCFVVALLAHVASRWIRHSELLGELLPPAVAKELDRTGSATYNGEVRLKGGTPAEQLISILAGLLEHNTPFARDVSQLIAALQQQSDLYTPWDVLGRLHKAGMDQEAAASLMAALGSQQCGSYAEKGDQNGAGNPLQIKAVDDVDGTDVGQQDVSLHSSLLTILGVDAHVLGASHSITASLTTMDITAFYPKLTFSEIDTQEVLSGVEKSQTDLKTMLMFQGTPQPVILLELEVILMVAHDIQPEFDAWQLNASSLGHPLAALGFWVFHQSGLIKEFNISVPKLIKFLQTVEGGYRANPYHNATHAADVLQSVHAMMLSGGFKGAYAADSFTVMACYIAAIIHDYEHKGVTNDFLINTRDELALRYNDRCPQENHHLSAAFIEMSKPELNFLGHFSMAEWMRLRKLVIELVLATDMRQNFAILGQFTATHSLGDAARRSKGASANKPPSLAKKIRQSLQLPRDRTDHASSCSGVQVEARSSTIAIGHHVRSRLAPRTISSHAGDTSSSHAVIPVAPDLDDLSNAGIESSPCNLSFPDYPVPLDEAERLLGLQMMLKCCDLGHVCAKLEVHLKWVAALEEEMFQQGDKEKALGLPTSPLCDRMQEGVTKSQVGFFDVVVMPLMTSFCSRFPAAAPIQWGAEKNLKYWQRQASGAGLPKQRCTGKP